MRLKKIFAFTLAEVLITLSILGVVAAITVPSLINRQNEKEFVTKLKKEYSALAEAFEISIVENGPVSKWSSDLSGSAKSNAILQKIAPYLNITKNCGNTDRNSCADANTYKTLNYAGTWGDRNFRNTDYATAIFKDGALIGIKSNGCISIDLNGNKGPNRLGVDTFDLNYDDKGMYIANPDKKWWYHNCTAFGTDSYNYNGSFCTGWVLRKNNMEYLRKDTTIDWN